jgi:hypothetical protein
METWKHGDKDTENMETWGHGNMETWRHRNKETWPCRHENLYKSILGHMDSGHMDMETGTWRHEIKILENSEVLRKNQIGNRKRKPR